MEHAITYGNRLVMLYKGKIVVDVRGEEKKNLTVSQLMDLFHKNSGQQLNDDALVLGYAYKILRISLGKLSWFLFDLLLV